jgi:hypothetical protein
MAANEADNDDPHIPPHAFKAFIEQTFSGRV